MDDRDQDSEFRVSRPATPLRQLVTDTIRRAIASGRFRAGERMSERELCEMTGVSRTLIREALRQLETEGIIATVAHRGPVVAAISPEQADGIYQVRELLEGLAAELFARRASERDRAALLEAFEDVKRMFETSDVVRWLAAKDRFYQCLLDGAKNEALAASLSMLNSRMTVLRARSLQMPQRRASSTRELGELITHLMARDARSARLVAVAHVREAGRNAIRSMLEEQARARTGTAAE